MSSAADKTRMRYQRARTDLAHPACEGDTAAEVLDNHVNEARGTARNASSWRGQRGSLLSARVCQRIERCAATRIVGPEPFERPRGTAPRELS